ncbi:MAG: DUF4837 family protein [Balneolales bacterium]
MRNTFLFLWPLLFLAGISACDNDYRRPAQGPFSEVLVVMDSTRWDSSTAEAIRHTFGSEIMTLPRPEERYDLRFMTLRSNNDLEYAKRHKNAIFVATIDEESNVGSYIRSTISDDIAERVRSEQNFAFPLRDRWYKNQWTLILSSTDDETLAAKIRDTGQSLVSNLDSVEIQRWQQEVYRRGEQIELSDSLMNTHGFSIRVQHDYNIGVDTTDFVSLRRFLSDNDRWIWVWWQDDVDNIDHIDSEWINAKRDSLQEQYIRGSREESYVQTEYRRQVETTPTRINGRRAFETRGTWRMENDLMGGPFLNYTVFDEDQDRLYLMEFAQFAPGHTKRRFVYQFEAMANTFDTDSTWMNQQAITSSN